MRRNFLRYPILITSLIALTLMGEMPAFSATVNITVDVSKVLNDITDCPIGINTDYWWDDQANRPQGSRSLSEAFKELGVKYLRYPGGEKSDGYLWSVPPFTAPNPRLARISDKDWPASDKVYWVPEGDPKGTWNHAIYDFDEFMTDCINAGAEPVIVIAYDGIYKPANTNGTSLTKQQALDTAKAWVKYANITKGYKIKYWSIGNETWIGNTYMGNDPGAIQYGKDADEFAKAMKKIDPFIKIGINGNSTEYFDQALKSCAHDIDFLDAHTYPCYAFTCYDDYFHTDLTPGLIIDAAQNAINKLSSADKKRIFIAVTETSALSFNDWDKKGNDTGHALANFDIFSQLLSDPRVKFSQFWCTRWTNNNASTPQATDFLTASNGLNASGKAMAILSQNMLDKVVSSTSTSTVKSFASYSPTTGDLNICLINKSKSSTAVNVDCKGYNPLSPVERWVFKGKGDNDMAPEYKQIGNPTINDSKISLTLDPVSITVLKLKKSIFPASPSVNKVDDNDKIVTGKTETAATVEVSKGNVVIGTATGSTDGSFIVRIPVQKAGTVLQVKVRNTAGYESRLVKITVKDGTPPPVPIVNTIKSTTKIVTGKAEAGVLVAIKKGTAVVGSAYAKSNGSFTITIKAQSKGTILYITAKDKAGNVSSIKKVTVVK
jgi:alpha-L-arabinofuranosidase